MKTVHKYEITDWSCPVTMPVGAKIIHVADQYGAAMMWAVVDPSAPTENRHFRIAGTGGEIEDDIARNHVGTFLVNGGAFVWHVFEVI